MQRPESPRVVLEDPAAVTARAVTPMAFRVLETTARALRRYHRHRVVGIETFPRSGPVVVAVNHSFISYDILLLGGAIYESTGRIGRALGDRLIFKIPGLGDLAAQAGVVQGSPSAASDLLRAGEVIVVAPGGMREALRPSTQRHAIMWGRRTGFAREALRAGAPVVLAACPAADDIYTLYANALTKWAYRHLRVPLPVLRGMGPTLLPRPVRLVHHISEALFAPPLAKGQSESERLDAFHAMLVDRMGALMTAAAQDS